MRTEIPIQVLDSTGNPVSGASILINIRGGAAATIYGSEAGAGTLANPLLSDLYGRVTGWLDRGAYDAIISAGSIATYTESFDSVPGRDGAIDSSWIASGAVTSAKIATGAVTSAGILDGSITGADIASGTITSANILDGTIANADIASNAGIAVSKLAAGSANTVLTSDGATDSFSQILNAHVSSSAAIAVSKLAAGTNGQYLQTTGGVPVWGAAPSGPAALSWTNVATFSNSWVNEGSGTYYSAGYAKDSTGSTVYLRGAVKGGSSGAGVSTTAFQLPAGFRPTKTVLVAAHVKGGSDEFFGGVTIDTSGNVSLNTDASTITAYGLDGISFGI